MMLRLVFRGEPLDQAFIVHLVDDVVLPLLGRPVTTGGGHPR